MLSNRFVKACLVIAAAVPISTPAYCASQPATVQQVALSKSYIRTEAGVGLINDVSVNLKGFGSLGDLGAKAGPALSVAYGYRTSDQISLEGEVGYQKNNWDDGYTGGATLTSFLANWVYHNKVSTSSSLSAGFGIGSGIVSADIGFPRFGRLQKESQAEFMGQLRGLWQYALSPTSEFTLGYRFKYISGPTFSSGLSTDKVLGHVVSAGLSFSF